VSAVRFSISPPTPFHLNRREGGCTRSPRMHGLNGTFILLFFLGVKMNSAFTAAFVFATAMYITVTIPTIRTVVMPVEGVDTREDQIAAMRVLSAGNTLIMVLLGGILALQVRPEWNSGCFSLSIFFCLFHAGTTGWAGMGSEIGVEGIGEDCGRGSESKRSR